MNASQLIYFFIISAGSLLGANLRYLILNKFKSIKLNTSKRLLFINSIASLILGISLSLNNVSSSKDLSEAYILFLIGFAGSLSTFASFINDLFNLSLSGKYKDTVIIIFLSLSFGLISILVGLFLGNF